MLRYAAPAIVFAGMVAMFYFALGRDPGELPSPYLGKPAPQFELPRVKDPSATIGSADYAGQTVLVNIWATWCVGCRQEHDFLLQLANSNAIPIIGINWRDQRQEAITWLRQLGDPYVASGYDADGRVGIDWGAYGAPETFLIGPDGTVLYKHISPLTQQVWEQEFVPRIEQVKQASL
ncbi:MAG: DsbE family thiol:disulfide interchange protein [Gammaproteobacteria bacterium]|nr:DsbE family thiol:disulfide interchange protein [Gammaproteobacteria bacterium]